MLIVLSGLPGVGKTTIARELARSLPAVHVRVDSIEQTLRRAGLNVEGEGYDVAYAVAANKLALRDSRYDSMKTGLFLLASLSLLACSGSASRESPGQSSRQAAAPRVRFVREVPWVGRGTWIAYDGHVQTTFSDGASTPDEVVAQAIGNGCGAIAITDHADRNLKAATPEYRTAIEALRSKHPTIPIVAGIEWNWPPFGGQDHVGVLVPDSPEQWEMLAYFKEHFDDYHRTTPTPGKIEDAFNWLATRKAPDGLSPIVISNHPSRKYAKSAELFDVFSSWHRLTKQFVAFEGAPGHQGLATIGAYDCCEKTVDRWDPIVRTGDTWDRLLQSGADVWGALANSDFHSAKDRWPCQFSETWLYVPEPSVNGIIRALSAGSFFAAHGHIVRHANLTLTADGLSRPAMSGEVIEAPVGTRVTVHLAAEIPERDWQGKPNEIAAVEFIAISSKGAESISNMPPLVGREIATRTISVPAGGIVVRARGRRRVAGEPDQMFYTNPIRVLTR